MICAPDMDAGHPDQMSKQAAMCLSTTKARTAELTIGRRTAAVGVTAAILQKAARQCLSTGLILRELVTQWTVDLSA